MNLTRKYLFIAIFILLACFVYEGKSDIWDEAVKKHDNIPVYPNAKSVEEVDLIVNTIPMAGFVYECFATKKQAYELTLANLKKLGWQIDETKEYDFVHFSIPDKQYVVQFMENNSQKTTVLFYGGKKIEKINIEQENDSLGKDLTSVPRPPNSVRLLHEERMGKPASSITVIYRSYMDALALKEFYESAMNQIGWKMANENLWTKNRAQCFIAFSTLKKYTIAIIYFNGINE